MIHKTELKIAGMRCASCEMLIKGELEDKVNKISVDSKKGEAVIEFDEKKISEKEIKKIIEGAGDYKIR